MHNKSIDLEESLLEVIYEKYPLGVDKPPNIQILINLLQLFCSREGEPFTVPPIKITAETSDAAALAGPELYEYIFEQVEQLGEEVKERLIIARYEGNFLEYYNSIMQYIEEEHTRIKGLTDQCTPLGLKDNEEMFEVRYGSEGQFIDDVDPEELEAAAVVLDRLVEQEE